MNLPKPESIERVLDELRRACSTAPANIPIVGKPLGRGLAIMALAAQDQIASGQPARRVVLFGLAAVLVAVAHADEQPQG